MTSRILATFAALCAFSLAAAPTAQAGEAAPPAGPLATDWLAAEPPLLPTPSDAPLCRPGDPDARAARLSTAEKLARLREALAAEAAASPDGGGVVVLNNRGYNYGGNAVVDPALIEFEAGQVAR